MAAALVVAVGVALRLWHIGHGLPDFLDEAIPFKTALGMWVDVRRIDWNPHFFNYPSLTIYLQLALQMGVLALGPYAGTADFLLGYQIDPTPLVLPARLLGVAFDTLTLVGVVRIGERLHRGAGVGAAALVALAPTMIVTSRAIYTDTYMTAFAVWALERMLAFRAHGRRSQLVAATVLTGLAAGSKYPGALLLIPLAWVMFERRGIRGLGPWLVASAAALAVFLLTSPFVALDFEKFLADFRFESVHMAEGHLGSVGRRGFLFQAQTLAGDLGWPGMALLVASLGLTAAAPRRRSDQVTLWLFLIPVGLAISLAHVEAGRYLVPVIPIAAMLAAGTALDLADRHRPARTVVGRLAVGAILILPVLPQGARAGASGQDDTQARARRWSEANIPRGALLLREAYTGHLQTRENVEVVERSRAFALASAGQRERFLSRRAFDAVDLPLKVAGYSSLTLRLPDGRMERIPIFEHPVDVNQIFYDLRLLDGVDFVLTSGAVRGRFDADTTRFAVQRRFYRFLDRFAERMASFPPGRGTDGPQVDIYRLGDRARGEIARAGGLPALWWAECVPGAYPRGYEALAAQSQRRGGVERLGPDGEIAPWVRSLTAFFDAEVRPFAQSLARELARHDHVAAALPLAEAIHLQHPGEVRACIAFVQCAGALERWPAAEAAMARTIAVADRADPALPELRLERARVLVKLGRTGAARSSNP
jgi:dolichyl-phosphate-mannose-protein mannosyltransferase